MTDEQFIRLASEGLCQVIDARSPASAPVADRMAMRAALAAACEVELPEVTAASAAVVRAIKARRALRVPQSASPVRT